MKQATINIIRCILKQEECMTPPMIRRFIDWIQMSEHQHRMNVSQDRVMSVAATCALLNAARIPPHGCEQRAEYSWYAEAEAVASATVAER